MLRVPWIMRKWRHLYWNGMTSTRRHIRGDSRWQKRRVIWQNGHEIKWLMKKWITRYDMVEEVLEKIAAVSQYHVRRIESLGVREETQDWQWSRRVGRRLYADQRTWWSDSWRTKGKIRSVITVGKKATLHGTVQKKVRSKEQEWRRVIEQIWERWSATTVDSWVTPLQISLRKPYSVT